MAPAPQWLTNDFFKDIIKRAIDHEISISDDEIIAYISKKRNNQIKSKTWITYVELKITEEPELKEIVRKSVARLRLGFGPSMKSHGVSSTGTRSTRSGGGSVLPRPYYPDPRPFRSNKTTLYSLGVIHVALPA